MNIRIKLLATVAASSLLASAGHAAPAKKHHTRKAHPAAASANHELLEEVRALRAQVESLQAKVDTQGSAQTATQDQIQSTQSQVQAVQAKVDATQTQVAAVPGQVTKQVDASIDKARHADKFYFKGITITPGGFLELAGIYRQHFMANDIATGFNSIPFPNSRVGHEAEGRFSARQSRVSFLAEGMVKPTIKLSMYGEFDFQGAAQTANSNESNSYNPRIRNLYGTIDWSNADSGLHLLAGQNWSLVTMNAKGITPRNELTPPQIDAQYIPGFAWTRTPQVRVTGDFLNHQLWVAVSAENPQTTVGGTVPSTVTYNTTGGSGFNSANSLSTNHVPDFVGKVAYETVVGGHGVHMEAFGIYRQFDAHLSTGQNESTHGTGYGGGITLQVIPKVLDLQGSAMHGRGIGRYGSSQLPDVTFTPTGAIAPLEETMVLFGGTLHATPMLDIYGFGGGEWTDYRSYAAVAGTIYGYGNPLLNNSGCLIEGGTCNGNSRVVRQLTAGVWEKIYQGPFGRAQIGFQYSYTDRTLFAGVGGAPKAKQNMGFVSFRYYPF